MSDHEHQRYIPEHAVPMDLKTVAKSKKERIEFGTIVVVRVQVMGILESIEINESDVDFIITDEKHKNRVMVQKIISATFPRGRAEELLVGDYVEVFGKIRILDDGKSFLNALCINVVSVSQYKAYRRICRMSQHYYEKNIPSLPGGTSTNKPEEYGLKKRVGNLDRFPILMLEESSSVENNMGIWPKEIEELAAGISTNIDNGSRAKVEINEGNDDDDDPYRDVSTDDDSEEEDGDDEEGEEKKDGRDAVANESDDSFEAGPVNIKPLKQVQNEIPKEETLEMDDSFDEVQSTVNPVNKKQLASTEMSIQEEITVEVEFDSFENL